LAKTRLLRIGTRGSALARVQTELVARRLAEVHPDLAIETAVIRTTGDRAAGVALWRLGGQGAFTRELEDALRARRIDLAVHSLKDLPTTLAEDLALGAVSLRADPADALVGRTWDELAGSHPAKQPWRIGTSSLRRRALVRRLLPQAEVVDLRGNVETRLRKVAQGELDAAVLACAGLIRLGQAERIVERLDPARFPPAPGQGALAVEIRTDDDATREIVRCVHDANSAACTTAERAVLSGLGGGCHIPLGAWAELRDHRLTLRAVVLAPDGERILESDAQGPPESAEQLGRTVAQNLLGRGAAEIIAAADRSRGTNEAKDE